MPADLERVMASFAGRLSFGEGERGEEARWS
jgi:hypothetical protein